MGIKKESREWPRLEGSYAADVTTDHLLVGGLCAECKGEFM